MDNLNNYHQESRPWGSFEQFIKNEPATVKIITVNPGQAFSLQTHSNRSEFWYILSGTGTVTIGDIKKEVGPKDTFMIDLGATHRAEAGTEPLVFLEIAFGEFDENDITRLEDKYGRI